MNIIIPMAGRGTRMRPHTLTTPKPLLPIAGKPIVQRLVEDLIALTDEPIEEIGFIIGDFGEEVEDQLRGIAMEKGAKGKIFYQDKALGTAHAILCAKELLKEKVIIAFADTLFETNMAINTEEDGIIFTQKVDDPTSFGVVTLDQEGYITGMVEKPETFVSDQAIIGIYYFQDGFFLQQELKFLLDNGIKTKGEFQLTDAMDNMRKKGARFKTGEVTEWLDCGNKDATVNTNRRILELKKNEKTIADSMTNYNSVIIPPCYIGENVVLENSVIGPHVSIGNNTVIKQSILSNSIIQANSYLENKIMENSMLGNHVSIKGTIDSISVGDYSYKSS
ncbi:MAG: NTP transferase domain-containing protein [Saprospiraceae bacterium]|nr:NTP transferase domain-containing protein [Saprospiraceae bacterium]